ncbi:predicted protein [Naegleria gruberi]|uniref:Predicted protein n=1 Tax=Naegleria gruberi TaxID=5762 RepID=D2VV33_NAEGR|nr:uncharacterized protein NAEGRDRAFT_72875 [Naegleria gruberi]EFC39371.1 predicted protein [Naegleria gruberi]|eukprot:XP_002672115.1 predicted protein [Naegleria gruberi strain NEG-M]
MLLLLFPIVICILVAVGTASLDVQQKEYQNVGGIFNTILCFVFLTMNGGGVVLIEIYKRIRYAKSQKTNSADDLENILKNEDLFNLFREYSEKEFSLENIEFYSVMLKLKVQKVVSEKELDEIDDTFIKNYSKYEVNLPSSCKREFYKLKEQAQEKTHQVEYSALWQVFGNDLVLNMMDTFRRLQETSNYSQWESVSKYQKHIHP